MCRLGCRNLALHNLDNTYRRWSHTLVRRIRRMDRIRRKYHLQMPVVANQLLATRSR